MADEQKKYPYAGLDFFQKFADTIAEKFDTLAFKPSDAVRTISDKSTDDEIPTAKAVYDLVRTTAEGLKNEMLSAPAAIQ